MFRCPHTFGQVKNVAAKFKTNLKIMSSGKNTAPPVPSHMFLSVKSDMHTVLTVSLPRSHQYICLKTEVQDLQYVLEYSAVMAPFVSCANTYYGTTLF